MARLHDLHRITQLKSKTNDEMNLLFVSFLVRLTMVEVGLRVQGVEVGCVAQIVSEGRNDGRK